jgi:hypothetical protein
MRRALRILLNFATAASLVLLLANCLWPAWPVYMGRELRASYPPSGTLRGRFVDVRVFATEDGQIVHYHPTPLLHAALMPVLAALPVWWVAARWRVTVRRSRGLCPACGYDLRATPDRCPECGAAAAGDGTGGPIAVPPEGRT